MKNREEAQLTLLETFTIGLYLILFWTLGIALWVWRKIGGKDLE